jgi:hypothetical protein
MNKSAKVVLAVIAASTRIPTDTLLERHTQQKLAIFETGHIAQLSPPEARRP